MRRLASAAKQTCDWVDSVQAAAREDRRIVTDLRNQLERLTEKMTDMEDRSRRNNVRLVGLPEGAEGSDAAGFLRVNLSKWIPSLKDRCSCNAGISTESTASLTAEATPEFKVLCCSLSASLIPLAIASSRSSLEMVESLNLFFIMPPAVGTSFLKRSDVLKHKPHLNPDSKLICLAVHLLN